LVVGALLKRALFFRQQRQLERGDNRLRDLVLQREDVVEVPVVALAPDLRLGRRVDELRRDPHSCTGLADASDEDVVGLGLPADLADAAFRALE
jgi:hypothetical protein